jgi:hypothetical protein
MKRIFNLNHIWILFAILQACFWILVMLKNYSPYTLRGRYTEWLLWGGVCIGSIMAFNWRLKVFNFSKLEKWFLLPLYSASSLIFVIGNVIILSFMTLTVLFSHHQCQKAEYFSPSQQHSLSIEESCWMISCGHGVFLNQWLLQKYLGQFEVIGEGSFCAREQDLSLNWSQDERYVSWKFKGLKRQGTFKL